MGSNPVTGVLVRRGEFRHIDDWRMKIEAEFGVMLPQTKETLRTAGNHQKLKETSRDSLLKSWREHRLANTLILDF